MLISYMTSHLTLESTGAYEIVSLGVGTKFMAPAVVLADEADELIHDSHAEVIARRSLQR